MKRLMSLLMSLVLLIGIGVPAFSADKDIVEIAVGNEDFSILVAALQKAELVGALQGEGPFTALLQPTQLLKNCSLHSASQQRTF